MRTYYWEIERRHGLAWFPTSTRAHDFTKVDGSELDIDEFAAKTLAGAELADGGRYRILIWRERDPGRGPADLVVYWPDDSARETTVAP